MTKFYLNLHTRQAYNHTGYDVNDYFQSETTAKKVENAASDRFWSNSSGAAFSSPPIGGLLKRKTR